MHYASELDNVTESELKINEENISKSTKENGILLFSVWFYFHKK